MSRGWRKHARRGLSLETGIELLFFLLDTGVRAQEFLALEIKDVDEIEGDVQVRTGKGGKSRTTYLGKRGQMCLRAYLKHRDAISGPLWVSQAEKRLTISGLRDVLKKRAEFADVPKPALHAFRRVFAVGMLRNGCNPEALQKMMGHESLATLQPYLKLTNDNVREAHNRSSSVNDL